MNFKPIPIMITLAAAFISCVVSICQRVDFSVFVLRFAVTVAIFLVLGTIARILLESAFKVMEEETPIDAESPEESEEDAQESSEEDNQASQTE